MSVVDDGIVHQMMDTGPVSEMMGDKKDFQVETGPPVTPTPPPTPPPIQTGDMYRPQRRRQNFLHQMDYGSSTSDSWSGY